MHLTSWLAFTLAYTLMAITPGPTILLVVSYALSQGRRTALAVMMGTSLGDASALLAAMAGVGAILRASASAFLVLKLAGAAYLVFLGVRIWRTHPAAGEAVQPPLPRSLTRTFAHAYLTTLLNPKAILFYMVFVPQFLNEKAALLPQYLPMLATVAICGPMVDSSYTLFAGSLRRFIRTSRAQRLVNRTTGGLLIGEGLLAATWRTLSL